MEEIAITRQRTGAGRALAMPDPAQRLAGFAAPTRSGSRLRRRSLTGLLVATAAAAAVYITTLAVPGAASGQPPSEAPVGARQLAQSVLQVRGPACDAVLTGTAWVAGPGLLVTAAHVVAGVERPTVRTPGGAEVRAEPIHFDPSNDLAVLEVPGLDAPALELAASSADGTAARTLGFPQDRPFTVSRTRLGATASTLNADIYGDGERAREMTRFEGSVDHGSSGGPVVDSSGRVLTTVLGTVTGEQTATGTGATNELVSDALATAVGPVSTGPCV